MAQGPKHVTEIVTQCITLEGIIWTICYTVWWIKMQNIKIRHIIFHNTRRGLTPRSSLLRNASFAASHASAWSACSLNSCSWCACVSLCRRSSHAAPNVRLNSSRRARLGARSSWVPPDGRRIPKYLSDLNASCRPSISAWSKCIYVAWILQLNLHWCSTRKIVNGGVCM
jgi:hypothetical protein